MGTTRPTPCYTTVYYRYNYLGYIQPLPPAGPILRSQTTLRPHTIGTTPRTPHYNPFDPILGVQPSDPILGVQPLQPHTRGTTPSTPYIRTAPPTPPTHTTGTTPRTPSILARIGVQPLPPSNPILGIQPLRPGYNPFDPYILQVHPLGPHTMRTTPRTPYKYYGYNPSYPTLQVQPLRPHTVLWVQPRQPHTIPSTHTMGTIVYNLSDPIHTILTMGTTRLKLGYNPSGPILRPQPFDPILWVQPFGPHTTGTTPPTPHYLSIYGYKQTNPFDPILGVQPSDDPIPY